MKRTNYIGGVIGSTRPEVELIADWYFNEFRHNVDKLSEEELYNYYLEMKKEISSLYDRNYRNVDSVKRILTRIGNNTKIDYVLRYLRNEHYTPKTLNDFLDNIVPSEIIEGGKIKVKSNSEVRSKKFKNSFTDRGRWINKQAKEKSGELQGQANRQCDWRKRKIEKLRIEFDEQLDKELETSKKKHDSYNNEVLKDFKKYISFKFSKLLDNCEQFRSLRIDAILKATNYAYDPSFSKSYLFKAWDLVDLFFNDSIEDLLQKLKNETNDLDIDRKRFAITAGDEEIITYDSLKNEFLAKTNRII